MRAGDKTCLLSRDEQRVLSAIPREYAPMLRKYGLRLVSGTSRRENVGEASVVTRPSPLSSEWGSARRRPGPR
jgi:hypothetical protein